MSIQHIGRGAVISDGVVLPSDYWIGDYTFIGTGVKILGGPFFVGDYSKVHQDTFIYTQPEVFPGGHVVLGHNAWIGQNSVIDGSGRLVAGDNLGVGVGSQLYTHISNGDVLEGCRFHSARPMMLGHDVWFVGFCLVGPIMAGNKSMALLGSNVTHDMRSNRIYAGNPAKDMTEKMGAPYDEIDPTTKWKRLYELRDECFGTEDSTGTDEICIQNPVVAAGEPLSRVNGGKTTFNVRDRTYTKRGTPSEVEFMKWLVRYRAKFTPAGESSDKLIKEFLLKAGGP